jgi:dynein heavy chain
VEQTDNGFIHKVVQLQELLDVRHSVMLLGPAGCAKTCIWKILAASHNLGKPKKVCITEIVEPKAVPLPELYGYMTLAKEWKDGVVSIIMRGMSKNFKELGFSEYQTHKWIVFDGDIDTLWIERYIAFVSMLSCSYGCLNLRVACFDSQHEHGHG